MKRSRSSSALRTTTLLNCFVADLHELNAAGEWRLVGENVECKFQRRKFCQLHSLVVSTGTRAALRSIAADPAAACGDSTSCKAGANPAKADSCGAVLEFSASAVAPTDAPPPTSAQPEMEKDLT